MRIPPLSLVFALLIAGLLVAVIIYPRGSDTPKLAWCGGQGYSEPIPAGYDIHVKTGTDADGKDLTSSVKEVRMCLTGQLSADEAKSLLKRVRSYVITVYAPDPMEGKDAPKHTLDELATRANAYLSTQVSPEKWAQLSEAKSPVVGIYGIADSSPQSVAKGTPR